MEKLKELYFDPIRLTTWDTKYRLVWPTYSRWFFFNLCKRPKMTEYMYES